MHHGEGRWNGVGILSRVGLTTSSTASPTAATPTPRRGSSPPVRRIRVVNVYVPNGRSLDADHYQYKLRWLGRLAAHVEASPRPATTW